MTEDPAGASGCPVEGAPTADSVPSPCDSDPGPERQIDTSKTIDVREGHDAAMRSGTTRQNPDRCSADSDVSGAFA